MDRAKERERESVVEVEWSDERARAGEQEVEMCANRRAPSVAGLKRGVSGAGLLLRARHALVSDGDGDGWRW